MNRAWTKYLPPFIRSRLHERTILQAAIANTSWLFIDQVLRMGVGLFVSVWVARYLGPEKFGVYSYAFAFVALFSTLSTLGLGSIVIRDIVRNPDLTNETLGSAFLLMLTGGILVFLSATIALYLVRPNDYLTIWLVGIISAGMVFQAFDAVDLWFRSQVLSKYSVYAKSSAFLLANIVKVLLILTGASLIAFAWVALIEVVMGACGMVIAYQMKGHTILRWRGRFGRAKALLRESWPLILSGIFVLVNMNIDKVMIREISGNVEVGFYSAASRLSEVWYFIPVAVGASVMPTLIEGNSRDVSSYNVQLQKIYNIMTQIALFLALLISFLAGNIIHIVYGSEYFAASQILIVHIWSALFVFHVSIRSKAFIIEGIQHFIAIYAVFTMGSNILFNLILIPNYGGIGAAYASLLSWMISVLLLPWFSRRTIQSVPMFVKSFNFISFYKNF